MTWSEYTRNKESSTHIITTFVGLIGSEHRMTMHSGIQALEAQVIVDNSDTSMNVGLVSPGVQISKRLFW